MLVLKAKEKEEEGILLILKAKKEEVLKIAYLVLAKTKVLRYLFKTIREYSNKILAILEIESNSN